MGRLSLKFMLLKVHDNEDRAAHLFLFNLFYKCLVSLLSGCNGGIHIGPTTFNTFCYADDLLLCSLIVTGSRQMINVFIYSHVNGLSFNPSIKLYILCGVMKYYATS